MKLLLCGSCDSEVNEGVRVALCLHHTAFVLFKEKKLCWATEGDEEHPAQGHARISL